MKKIAFIYIILASILWGTSGIFVHFLAPYRFSSIHMTFFRSVVSFLCLFLYIFVCDRKLLKVSLKELILFACSGVSFFATASCYFYSMQVTSISTAVVLMYTAPIFVMIYSVAFLGEKLTKLKFISVICMIIGCGLVSGIIGGLKFNALGIAVGFLSGISYSAYNIFTKINMKNHSNPLSTNLYCFLFASIVGMFTSDMGGIPEYICKNPPIIITLLIALGICTCIMPYFLYTLALKEIPAGTASSLAILEPMAATVFSVLIFGEKLTIPSLCGIILILGSVYLLSKNET